jgi:Mn2+/Fe2+ NRAMP family transporter
MLYAEPWEQPSAVATLFILILLSAGINFSTRCTLAAVAISTERPGRAPSATFERH